jgi:hypothetical protein
MAQIPGQGKGGEIGPPPFKKFRLPSALGEEVHKLETFGLGESYEHEYMPNPTPTPTPTSTVGLGQPSPGFNTGTGGYHSVPPASAIGQGQGLKPLTVPLRSYAQGPGSHGIGNGNGNGIETTILRSIGSSPIESRIRSRYPAQVVGYASSGAGRHISVRTIYDQAPNSNPGGECVFGGERGEEEYRQQFQYPQLRQDCPLPFSSGNGNGNNENDIDQGGKREIDGNGNGIGDTYWQSTTTSSLPHPQRTLPNPSRLPYTPWYPSRPPVIPRPDNGDRESYPHPHPPNTPLTASHPHVYSGSGVNLPGFNDLFNDHGNHHLQLHQSYFSHSHSHSYAAPSPALPTTVVPTALRQSRSATLNPSNDHDHHHIPNGDHRPGLGGRSNSSLSVSVVDRFTPISSPTSDFISPADTRFEISFESEEEEGDQLDNEDDDQGSEYRPSKKRVLATAPPPIPTNIQVSTHAQAQVQVQNQITHPPPPPTQVVHPAPMSTTALLPRAVLGVGRDILEYKILYYIEGIGYMDHADVKQTPQVGPPLFSSFLPVLYLSPFFAIYTSTFLYRFPYPS